MSNPVYAHVVGDVVGKLRERFVIQGVDDSFLDELRLLWELKLMQRDTVIQGQPRGPAIVPVHESSTSCSNYVQEQTPATNQRLLGVDLNVAYHEDFFMPPEKRSKLDSPPHLLPPLGQQHGSLDSLGQEKVPAVNTPDAGTNNNLGNLEGEEDDEELNVDDDVLEQEEDEESSINQLVLAQFVKVDKPKRSNKRRWKCTLMDGILHLNDRDILFSKAGGDFGF